MPPKEKSQLTSIEIEILKSWIASGADFEKTITQTGQLSRIQNLLTDVALSEVPDVPIDEIERDRTQLSLGHPVPKFIFQIVGWWN